MPTKTLLVLVRQFGDVEDELIGDGVRAVRLPDDVREKIYQQNSQHVDRWDLFYGQYSHAILNVYDPTQKTDSEAEQEIVRAFIVLRIIQPASLGLHLIVEAVESPEGSIFSLQNRIGIQSETYVAQSDVDKHITRDVVRRARVLWPNIQHVCQNWEKHQRIIRALRFFEIGCANYNGEVRHILFHSALECMVCTHRNYIGRQVRERVKAICPGVTAEDVKDIWDMRGGLVHSGSIVEGARGREEELIQKLERIVRACLYRVLGDQEAVDIFSDTEKIKKDFPVEVNKVERKVTDEEILV